MAGGHNDSLTHGFLRFVMWLEDTDKSSSAEKVKINTLRTGLISDWQDHKSEAEEENNHGACSPLSLHPILTGK